MLSTTQKAYSITCKHCGSQHIERIPRGAVHRLISMFIPLKRYFCQRCLRRFVSTR